MICPGCNNEITDGLKFCSRCGVKLDGASMVAAPGTRGGPSWKSFIAVCILAALAYGGITGYMWYLVRVKRANGVQNFEHAQYNACITNLRWVIRKDPKHSTRERLILAKCYANNKQPGKAIDQLDDAAVWQPSNPEIFALWARLLVDLSKFEEAADKAGKALDLDANNRDALMAMGMAHAGMGRVQEAVAEFQRALDGAPKDEKIIIYNHIGKACEEIKDWDCAFDAYEDSIKVYPNQENVRLDLAAAYLRRDDYKNCFVHADVARVLFEPNTDGKKNAEKLTDTCLALMKDTELRACVLQRRTLDRQYFSYYVEFHNYYREIQTEPQEGLSKVSALEELSGSLLVLKEDYRKLECLVDDPSSSFELGRQTMRFMCERLSGAILQLVDFLNNPRDDKGLELFRRSSLELENSMKGQVRSLWKNEENFYKDLEPMLPDMPEDSAMGDQTDPSAPTGQGPPPQ